MDRYAARPDFENFWSVIDTRTYLPATFEGRRLVRMEKEAAEEVARLMNSLLRDYHPSKA